MKDISFLFEGMSPIVCPCKDGAVLYRIDNAGNDTYGALINKAGENGFDAIFSNVIAHSTVKTLSENGDVLYTSYSDAEKVIRVIAKEDAKYAKELGFDGDKKYDVLLTQLSQPYYAPDCGMSYLVRLADGRFVVIDGGFDEFDNVDHLWNVISSQNERGGKPVIAAWFVSHAHDDHCGVPLHFIDKYSSSAEIQNVLYNWAVRIDGSSRHPEVRFTEVCSENNGVLNVVTPRSGDRYVFGGVSFEMLFVGEDLYPAEIASLNDSSMVVKMVYDGVTVLFPGDALSTASDLMCARYTPDVLKCDILQVPHHGYYGGSEAFFKACKPEVLFWSCPNYWYPVVCKWGANPMLIEAPATKYIYCCGRIEVTLDLSAEKDRFLPYKNDNYYIKNKHVLPSVADKPGDTVYEETFPEGRRVSELRWSCLTGGRTGYGAAKIELESGKCTFVSHDDRYDVIEFVQNWVIEKVPSFTLTFSGKMIGSYDTFSLFYDYALPTVYSDEYALPLGIAADSPFDVKLVTDPENNKAFFTVNGVTKEVPFREVGGLHFILKGATVEFNNVKVVKN